MKPEVAIEEHSEKDKLIDFTVDGKSLSTSQKELTVGEILDLAGKDHSTHYLVEKKGKRERVEYHNIDEPVKIHKGSEFVTAFTGETPVS